MFITTEAIKVTAQTHIGLGAIGVDLNADHLAIVETNRHGNPVDKVRIPLVTYGLSSDRAKAVIGDAVKSLMAFAKDKGKPIIVEKLDFRSKKSQLEGEHKVYARMLSSLSYNRILELIQARAYDHGFEVKAVNPACTSVIGRYKFAQRYGLSTHHGAALAIARRGQRFSEHPNRQDQNASLLLVRKASEHVWSYWRRAARKPLALAALHRLRKQSLTGTSPDRDPSKTIAILTERVHAGDGTEPGKLFARP